MTVKELIEKLKELPQDMKVVVPCPDNYWADGEVVNVEQKKRYDGREIKSESVVAILQS